MFDQPLYPAVQNSQTFLCDHIFHVSSSSFSSAGLRWVSRCPQVQVIKHRPKQIQKAYPGLLEPGYSYSLAASATKPFNTDALDKKKAQHVLSFLLPLLSLSHIFSNRRGISSACFATIVYLATRPRHGPSIFRANNNTGNKREKAPNSREECVCAVPL